MLQKLTKTGRDGCERVWCVVCVAVAGASGDAGEADGAAEGFKVGAVGNPAVVWVARD